MDTSDGGRRRLLMAGAELPNEPVVKPLRTTLVLVAVYMILVVAYIWTSGILAARASGSVEELRRLETIKEIAFVVVSSAALFLLSWQLLSRISRQEMVLLEQRDALVTAERRAVAGVFASSVAHDINNILMLLRYDVAELLQAQELNPEHKIITEQLGPAVEDLAVMSKRLAAAGQKSIPGEFIEVDLVALAQHVVEFAKTHAKLRHCSIEVTGDHSLSILANPTIMRLMLLNLLINAGDATGGQGQIQINVHQANNSALIEVHDNGPGVPERERENLFTPYYTSKQAEGGVGLGLISVRVYAEAHAGTVGICDSHLGGACFNIRLPVRHEKARRI
ncbi:MAG: HAMP domain-containing sensor histidine kinase [Candidatus Hydrogenedentes bacterium]|nr:HAMP domain-containing sensor histidine kinase [Candidatus Hydrogenedentota bacterium]